MLLTKHEGEIFRNQTVYISGQAFVRCSFVGCTLVLRETVYHLEQCAFERCNWHVDWVLMWGSPESLREIKALVAMIEQSQQRQMAGSPGTQGVPCIGGMQGMPALGAPPASPSLTVTGVPGSGRMGAAPVIPPPSAPANKTTASPSPAASAAGEKAGE